jgi:hypothetical protein
MMLPLPRRGVTVLFEHAHHTGQLPSCPSSQFLHLAELVGN